MASQPNGGAGDEEAANDAEAEGKQGSQARNGTGPAEMNSEQISES